MFLVLKRTTSVALAFEYPLHMFRLKNKIIIFRYGVLSRGIVQSANTQRSVRTFAEPIGPDKMY